MRKNYEKKDFKKKSIRKDWVDEMSYKDGKPEKESEKVALGLSAKSLKNLPKSSYSILADPFISSSNPSQPYPSYNAFNRNVGGNYRGDKNLDGGNVSQYNNSESSKMLKAFDVARLKIEINYRYLPIKPRTQTNADYGKELVNEMRKSISEAMSVLQSTTYTQMAIYNFAIETDLPMGDATTVNIANGSTPINAYVHRSDVFYGMSVYYQLVLLNLLNTLKWHNSFRLKQGAMIRNAWNREVPLLNAFFGLMNKKAFLSLLDSINLTFEGEYVDVDFAKQAAMINYAPSRRANDYLDPVLEVQTAYNHPSRFKVYVVHETDDGVKIVNVNDTPLFQDSDIGTGTGDDYQSFWDTIDKLNSHLSMEATTLWARTTTYTGIASTDNARYNIIKALFDRLIIGINAFKPKWSDFREACDTLARAGIISWTRGFRPVTEPSTDAEMFNNLLVNDIFRMILGGANAVTFDNYTKRWRTFSLWNMYTGIPESDSLSGGAFLTLSFKSLVISSDDDANVKYLPIIFDRDTVGDDNSTSCVIVSRDGKEAIITSSVETVNQNKALARLVPLTSQDALELRIPTCSTSKNSWLANNASKAVYFSFIYKALINIAGYCKLIDSTVSDYGVDPDFIAIYQVEIEDITNMAITYARANSPIRGTTSDQGLLGFFGLSSQTNK